MQSAKIADGDSEINYYVSGIADIIENYKEKYNPITPPSKTHHRGFSRATPAFVGLATILDIAEKEELQPVLIKGADNWELYIGNNEKYDPVTGEISSLGSESIRLFGKKYVEELVKGEVFPQLLWGNYRNGNLSMPAGEFAVKFKYSVDIPEKLIGVPICSEPLFSGLYCLAVYRQFA